jgi:hypothetical protein
MTEEQIQKLFDLVGTSISETREVRRIVEEHSIILKEHSAILKEHSDLHKDHTEKLDLLINRTSNIANTVMTNDKKRLTQVEKDITEIRGGVH